MQYQLPNGKVINLTIEEYLNLTDDDLLNKELFPFILKKMNDYSISPDQLTIEILESTSLSQNSQITDRLVDIRKMGFKIAIDDFGTENSNFTRLTSMHADFIKIDGSFIKELDTNDRSYQIAIAITNFSHNLGIEVVAEYVHSAKIQEIVDELGIDYSQGYYISEPMPSIDW